MIIKRPGTNLTFDISEGQFPMKNTPRGFVVIRITDVDSYKEATADPWWGLPSGGERTERERARVTKNLEIF